MNTLSPTGSDQPPAFSNTAECRAWLDKAPLTDVAQMHAMFLRQVNLLNRFVLPDIERLDILEILRGPIHETQEEISRKFAGKALPMAPAEQATFDASRALWHGLATGYMRCAEACFGGDAGLKPQAALILQRAIAALAAEQFETHRANQIPSAEHWRTLHQLYAAAEQLNATELAVMDAPRLGKTPGSAAAAYVEALLLQAASLHEQNQRHIAWIARWARRWAAKVRVLAAPPTLSTQAIPLCVDLAADRPAGYRPINSADARWLETAELRRSLKKRLVLLEQGEPPARLNLGEDCNQPACGQMLKHVYQRWCKGGAVRGFERRPASGTCRVIAGTEAIHYYLSDRKPFKPPGSTDSDMLRRERDEIATFGRVASHRDEHHSEQQGYAIEDWQVQENWHMVDASATGLRIARPAQQGGMRIGHGQLIAACPADAQSFLLGSVRWALIGNELQAGVYLFPGKPEAVALRGSGPAAAGEKYRQAFLLPAVAAIRQDASVIMPVGTFKLGKTVEIYTGQTRQLRLNRLVERGADYERATYEAA
ncbi:MAG: hypothetical protein Q7U97_03420 [Rhodocyclaceae bacterium]|nr:hypothetical protein [Rhodocyclaceae bacterium]